MENVCLSPKRVWSLDGLQPVGVDGWSGISDYSKHSIMEKFFYSSPGVPKKLSSPHPPTPVSTLVLVSCIPRWGQSLKISLWNEPISLNLTIVQLLTNSLTFKGNELLTQGNIKGFPLLLKWVRPIRKPRALLHLCVNESEEPFLQSRSSGQRAAVSPLGSLVWVSLWRELTAWPQAVTPDRINRYEYRN